MTQTSACLYNNLIAADSLPLTSYSSSTAHCFSFGTWSYAFSRSKKHVYPLWQISTIFQKLAEGQKFGPWRICQNEIPIVHPELRLDYFTESLFKALRIDRSRKT